MEGEFFSSLLSLSEYVGVCNRVSRLVLHPLDPFAPEDPLIFGSRAKIAFNGCQVPFFPVLDFGHPEAMLTSIVLDRDLTPQDTKAPMSLVFSPSLVGNSRHYPPTCLPPLGLIRPCLRSGFDSEGKQGSLAQSLPRCRPEEQRRALITQQTW